MHRILPIFFSFIILLNISRVAAQSDTLGNSPAEAPPPPKNESAKTRINRGPRRVMLMSVVLPGSGQAYNKKYWKIPIMYGGFAVFSYLFVYNNVRYQAFKTAYNTASDTIPNNEDLRYLNYSNRRVLATDQLQKERDSYRRNRDLNIILFGVVYVLNIADAYVDAHLKNFKVKINDDLSMKVRPLLYANNNRQFAAGLTMNFTFNSTKISAYRP